MMRIGIFGGTFDPPHIGHLVLAADALDQLHLDLLLWVLTPVPPHKQGNPISPLEQRLELVEAAIEGETRFRLSRVEMDRPGPHYAADSVRLLREQYPSSELIYLIGGDSLRDLPLWYRPQEFLRQITELGVMHRPGAQVDMGKLEAQLPGLTEKVKYIESPLLDISSSDIRQRIAEGRSFCYFLSPPVYDLVLRKRYYHKPTHPEIQRPD
jgi:nicotinate-nucleotide adenylyltransferase